jgi:hypothetical protein
LYSHAGTLYHCSADYAFRPQQSQLTLPLAYFAYFRTPFMKKIIAGIFAFSLASVALAQHNDLMCYHNDPGRHERNRNIDVTHMKLSVSFNPAEATVFGVVTHQFRCLQDNVDTIFLNAPGITADSVWLNGKSISFRYNNAGLICNTNLKQVYNVQHNLKIKYTAKPKKGIYFIGRNVPEIEEPVPFAGLITKEIISDMVSDTEFNSSTFHG